MNLKLTSKAQEAAQPIPVDVILASQSIGRRQILEKLGVRFRQVVTQLDEESITTKDPQSTIKLRAKTKLEEILTRPRVYLLNDKVHNLVIAADSMAVYGRRVFGKAPDRTDAAKILKDLMGKTHTFLTAVSIGYLENDGKVKKRWDKVATTRVTLRKMNKAEMDGYVARYDFSRYAGAYALNEAPWDLVTKIDGSYTNVIGLPLEVILPIFRSLAIIA
ncbi:septum formation protein Maf [Candidatus Gottesmanbacteria bacterium RBG_16_43_7]|uniref:Nucleoside triphosphate pyrophosphatase n=1 Tax=Candidatus Gottesmanbacteria bacterium RBG_16_43_7 TaxID=1798373 RepID=A0A1F5Z8X1_9BACT|nr:MAG: septum formation protein Maf [Candidatus Gottesmanbacteria bacterium RBG_16_43_7]